MVGALSPGADGLRLGAAPAVYSHMNSTREASSGNEGFSALSESKMYRDYAEAFSKGTGLPLSLAQPGKLWFAEIPGPGQNPFCSLLSQGSASCSACYRHHCDVETEAFSEAKTLKCFAGLCETAVPVHVGGKVVAFLKTGQILLERSTHSSFSKIARKLMEWGGQVDLKHAEEAFFGTRVFDRNQYESLVKLLAIFAEHLAASANALQLARGSSEMPEVGVARHYIEGHVEEYLSLAVVAKVVNVSAGYFSQKFKQSTGMNFVEYVSRTRVEKARNLLQNPHLRISEIAFAVGFQSLSQFNRTFKKVTGESPSSNRSGPTCTTAGDV
jgi:AraC-like DNA-binding protein